MIKFPQQINASSPITRAWIQPNRGDIFGSLVGSFNIDLYSNIGKVRGTRTINNIFTADDSDLTNYPVGFKSFNDGSTSKIYTVAGTKVHSSATNTPNATFAVDSTSGTPVDCDSSLSDIETVSLGSVNYLCVTANSKIYYRSTGNWSSQSFSGAGPWIMSGFAGRLYFTAAGLTQIFSTADLSTIATPTAQYSLDIPDKNLRTTFLRASFNRLWIGTVNTNGGKGFIYEWDGSASTPTRTYRLESSGALSAVIQDDYPVVTDTNGRILKYSAGVFKEVTRLPLNDAILSGSLNTSNNRFIHPNGMTLVNGRVNLLINNAVNDNAGSIPEFCPSGIWELDDLTNSLYHKYSLSYTPKGTNTITDYGQNRISAVGGLSEMKVTTAAANYNGNLLAGAKVFLDASSTSSGIFFNDMLTALSGSNQATQKSGYFVTSKMPSAAVRDTWRKLFIKHKQFEDSGDEIVVKYRTTESDPVDFSIASWPTTASFTTTSDLRGKEGYEVEITQGTGSGKVAHITKVDFITGSVYQVYLDEIFTGVTGTGKARYQNWTKIPTVATDQVRKSHEFPINMPSEWIQLKVYFLFKDRDEIDEILMVNSTQDNVV